ncbi:MAG: MarR family transcriptional regulator [Acidimicrobiales bacterium]
MTAPSDPRMLVMHGLRLKGFAGPAAVAETVAVPEAEAKVLLDQLVAQELVTYRDGRLSGFTLTPPGRAEHARLLSAELDTHGVRDAIKAAYAKFLGLNSGLLEVCTSWQLREVDGDSTMNDHSDPGYDAGVVDQLAELHGRVHPICEELGAALARYGHYGPRLVTAIDRVRAGEIDWFTKPMIASYHTVWFELHEDLLATLGIERGSEAVG